MEIVPPVFQTVGHFFPTAWAMDGLHGVLTFGHGLSALVVPTIVLLIYGTVFAVLGARSMRIAQ